MCCNNSPVVFKDSRWVCGECNSVVGDDTSSQMDLFDYSMVTNAPLKLCQCGATKTANPTFHAFWCPAYETK